MRPKRKKSAQERQDEIWQKMSVTKKIRLTAELSNLCLKLNQLGKEYGVRKTPAKNS